MIDTLALIGHLLHVQTREAWLALLPWHLVVLLGLLAILAAFGLHFLFGHVFRFYWRNGRRRYWISLPSLVMCLASLLVLLVSYLIWMNAPALIHQNLQAADGQQNAERVGTLLLEPAYKHPVFKTVEGDEVLKADLLMALEASTDHEYRRALRVHQVDPLVLEPGSKPAGFLLEQLVLSWTLNPDPYSIPFVEDWLAYYRPDSNAMGAEDDDRLPQLLQRLLGQGQEDVVLPRKEWAYVLGTTFNQSILGPVLLEYFNLCAMVLVAAVLLVNGIYLFLMSWLKRLGMKKIRAAQAAKKAQPKGADIPSEEAEIQPAIPPPEATTAVSPPKRKSKLSSPLGWLKGKSKSTQPARGYGEVPAAKPAKKEGRGFSQAITGAVSEKLSSLGKGEYLTRAAAKASSVVEALGVPTLLTEAGKKLRQKIPAKPSEKATPDVADEPNASSQPAFAKSSAESPVENSAMPLEGEASDSAAVEEPAVESTMTEWPASEQPVQSEAKADHPLNMPDNPDVSETAATPQDEPKDEGAAEDDKDAENTKPAKEIKKAKKGSRAKAPAKKAAASASKKAVPDKVVADKVVADKEIANEESGESPVEVAEASTETAEEQPADKDAT